jgi:hypothetical protein
MPSTTIKWLWSADLKLICEATTPTKTIANRGRANFFFILGFWGRVARLLLSSLGEGVVDGFLIMAHTNLIASHTKYLANLSNWTS